MMRTLINFAAFQIGWFACVLGAANGVPWLGVLVVGLVISLHLKMSDQPRDELQLLALAVILGLVFDSLLVTSGWVQYPNGMWVTGAAPYWILTMWALFATTLNVSMGWLKNSLVLASVLGAVFGPLSYVAGQRLGAIEFIDFRSSMIALAIIWSLAMPTLMYVASRQRRIKQLAPIVPLQKLVGRE